MCTPRFYFVATLIFNIVNDMQQAVKWDLFLFVDD